MKRLMLTALTAWAPGLFASAVQAQPQQPAPLQIGSYQRPQVSPGGYRPAVSPYMNILRGGTAGASFGYYGQARPQQEAFRSIQQLQTGLQGVQLEQQSSAGVGLMPPPGLGITGHPAAFFYYGPYYTFPSPRFGPPMVGGFAPGYGAGRVPGGTGSFGMPPGGNRSAGVVPFIRTN